MKVDVKRAEEILLAMGYELEGWMPIETAPKDGTLIIGFCNHEADEYRLGGGTKLTNYGCACEAYGHVEDGQHIIYWERETTDGSWEEGYYTSPGYWAAEGFDGECCANPTHWQPLPPPPGEKK